jgi:hypothetical protein
VLAPVDMWFLTIFLSLSLFVLRGDAGALCETGKVQCPSNFKCVANVGCVPKNATCRCPQQACEFPLRCDCRGGCKQKECGAMKTCGTSINPLNACETSICRNGFCVAAPLACDNCNSVTGCPESQQAVTVSDTDADAKSEVYQSEDWGGGDGDGDWSPPSTPCEKNQALLIGMSVFVAIMGAIIAGYYLYLSSTAVRA